LILILFRGSIYRFPIKYNEIGSRPEIKLTNIDLIKRIESNTPNRKVQLQEIVEIAQSITAQELKFGASKSSTNPNLLSNIKTTNCKGYSAMFNSIANYMIRRGGLKRKIVAEHKIGHLYFFGINLHQYLKSPFLKDHDFNEIKSLESGQVIVIDPSVNDYLQINSVAKTN